jgi:hypothetical protein
MLRCLDSEATVNFIVLEGLRKLFTTDRYFRTVGYSSQGERERERSHQQKSWYKNRGNTPKDYSSPISLIRLFVDMIKIKQ